MPCLLASLADTDERADMDATQDYADGPTEFGIQAAYRQKALVTSVRHEVGSRLARATLRKSAPIVGHYRGGETVSVCRVARKGGNGLQRARA